MVFIPKEEVKNLMNTRGFKVIGEGSNGIVFQSPRSREVLKLFRNDDGYKIFISIVAKNPQCIHFPKFRSYYKFPNWDGWHAIKLEPLNKINIKEWNTNYYWMEKIITYYEGGNWPFDKQLKLQIEESIKKYPTLAQACQILEKRRTLSIKPWVSGDMHIENVMKRSNGTIVIIDPFF